MASKPNYLGHRPALIFWSSGALVGTHENCLFRSLQSLFFFGEFPVRDIREFRAKALINGRYFA